MKWPIRLWPWLLAYALLCVAEFFIAWGKERVGEHLKTKPEPT